MDLILSLWTLAPDLKVKLLCLAVLAQMMLTIHVYTAMSRARVAAGKAGRITADTYKATRDEPEDLHVFTRAVANQFELPVMFYALIAVSLAVSAASWITVVLAFLFVVFRILHAREMITGNRVLKRRKLFIRTIQVFMVMLAEFAVSVLFFAQG